MDQEKVLAGTAAVETESTMGRVDPEITATEAAAAEHSVREVDLEGVLAVAWAVVEQQGD